MKNSNVKLRKLLLCAAVLFVISDWAEKTAVAGVLNADDYAHYVTYFNTMEPEENPTFAIIRNA